MSQVLRADKIGQLTHSAGNITMAASISSPAYLTIGGKQFTITSNLVVALPSMAANTRYQVFAVQSGGVVSLVISQNENSVGPAGFLSWKLVGSLTSNGAVAVGFGSFLNIEGVPKTDLINGGVLNITADTTAPTKGATITDDIFEYYRHGDRMIARLRYAQEVAGTAGSGLYFYNMPTNLVMSSNTAFSTAGDNTATLNQRLLGRGNIHVPASSSGYLYFIPFDSSRLRMITVIANSTTILYHGSPAGNYPMNLVLRWECDLEVSIQGWSNTPIKDL